MQVLDKSAKDLPAMIYDVIIIGAGAAGLMSAVSALSRGKTVLILESNDKPGLKILISGGGRCNFTNLYASPEAYVSGNPHFCKSALKQFTQHDFISLVEEDGIAYYEKTLGQLFCEHSSKEILDLLLRRIRKLGGTLKTKVHLHKVEKEKKNIFYAHAENESYRAKNIIVACGGLSFPQLGATDFGYKLAKHFGHSITKLDPALDGFVFAEKEKKYFSSLSGISLETRVSCNSKHFEENILFTHIGISGPSILKASLYWHKGDEVCIDFLPKIKNLREYLDEKRKSHPKKMVFSLFSQDLPDRFLEKLFAYGKVKNKILTELTKQDMQLLETLLKTFRFTPKSCIGYKKAEITRGGVDTKDISSQTMESRLVPGLYFVGEVVDVSGLLGGYNFQWAWSSGWVAGKNV